MGLFDEMLHAEAAVFDGIGHCLKVEIFLSSKDIVPVQDTQGDRARHFMNLVLQFALLNGAVFRPLGLLPLRPSCRVMVEHTPCGETVQLVVSLRPTKGGDLCRTLGLPMLSATIWE